MHTPTRRLAFNLALAAFLLFAAAGAASAQSPCRVGFLNGTAPTIDGNNAGGEWSDASSITSENTATTPGTPCFGGLADQNGVNFPARVLSKRYTRAGQNFIGFYAEVMDSTSSGVSLSTGGIPSGERFVVVLDPNLSRGAALGTTATGLDYRVTVAHAWALSGSNITDAQARIADSNHTQCPAGVTQNWGADAAASGLVVAAQTMVGGYKFEVEIPLSALGGLASFPASEMGVAFVVINDFGTAGMGANASYVAFPNSINVSTTDNPVTGCHASWRVPDFWATTSSAAPPPGDVTISRMPVFWSSQALNAFQCGSSIPGYTYYPGDPCNVELKATPTNTTGAAQLRNFLFLWARHGTGDPLNYDVISLVENVNVAAMSPADVASGLWTNVPVGEPNHPCTRVYILPNTFRSDFDRNDILGITTRTQLMDMVAKYGLVDDNWAQKNISRAATGTNCPTANCSLPGPRRGWPAAGVEVASLAPRAAPASAAPYSGTLFESDARPRAVGLPVTVAARPPAATTAAQAATTRPPRVPNPGRRIQMTPREFKANSTDNVIVQVRSFETEEPRPGEPTYYRFARPTGGVIQMFPVEMFRERNEIPFQLEVSAAALPTHTAAGSGGVRLVSLMVDLHAPQGVAQNVEVYIDTAAQPIRGDETRVVRGVLALPGRPHEEETFRRWGLSLHAGATIPHGTFDNIYNPGPNAGVDLEYRLSRTFSLEAIYTYNRFRGETFDFLGQPLRIPDANLHVLSLNGKVYGGTSPVRPFFNFGGGVYVFGGGGSTRGGLNAGGGLQFDLTPTVALDSMYNFHNVFTSGSDLKYSTVQGGVRFRF